MQKYTQNVKHGIWDTTQTLRVYKGLGRAVLTYPWIKWVDNNGTLAHAKVTIKGQLFTDLLAVLAGRKKYDTLDGVQGAILLALDQVRG
jgi:hypothetical protein